MLQKADVITVASKGIYNKLNPNSKIILLIKNYGNPYLANSAKKLITFAYTGSLYPKLSALKPLLKALTVLSSQYQFILLYCGKDRDTWNQEFDGFIELTQLSSHQLPHQSSLAIQKLADILLVLTWNTDSIHGILTSKLGEYLLWNKPIIILINGYYEMEFEELCRKHIYCYIFFIKENPLSSLIDLLQKIIFNIDNQQIISEKLELPEIFENEFKLLKSYL
jgi:hypothetical protein